MARSIFSERLTILRKKKKMTQQQMAEHLGLSRSTYTCYEVGNSMPTAATLCALGDLFEVSLDYLLGRYEDPGMYNLGDPEYARGLMLVAENYRMMDRDMRKTTEQTTTLFTGRSAHGKETEE